MQARTVRMLQTLPPDLVERSWQLAVSESRLVTGETPRYTAVYVRPFEGRLDHENPSSATFDPRTRQQVVRVSTLKDYSPSWHAARRDAIRRMRAADAKRRRRR